MKPLTKISYLSADNTEMKAFSNRTYVGIFDGDDKKQSYLERKAKARKNYKKKKK